MSFAKCFTFRIGRGPTPYKELNEKDYIEFSTTLLAI